MRKGFLLCIFIPFLVSISDARESGAARSLSSPSRSVPVSLAVYFKPELIEHDGVFRKIENATGIRLIAQDVHYQSVYGYVIGENFVIVPALLENIPLEDSRRRYVVIAEYIFSLFPSVLLNESENDAVKSDLMRIAHEVSSGYFYRRTDNSFRMKDEFRDPLFLGFSLPEGILPPAEPDRQMLKETVPEVVTGQMVFLASRTLDQESTGFLPGEVVTLNDDGFDVRIEAGFEYLGTTVTDIKGSLYGLVYDIDPLQQTVRIVSIPFLREKLKAVRVFSYPGTVSDSQSGAGQVAERSEALPFFETGSTFFLITAERMSVFLGRRYLGDTPLLVPDAESGEHILFLDSDTHSFRGTVLVNPHNRDVITIKPAVIPKEDSR